MIGGLTIDFCGYSRAIYNVNIIIKYSAKNINLLLSSLIHFGQGLAKELSDEDFNLEAGCIRIKKFIKPKNQIDVQVLRSL